MAGKYEWLKAKLSTNKTAYRAVFTGAFGRTVLQDLIPFCRGTESTFNSDPQIHALLEGRREVLLRIAQHMNLSLDDLWVLYDGRTDNE